MKNSLRTLALGFATLLTVVSYAQGPTDLGSFTVDKVELKRDFHGKLGAHLCETLTLIQGAKRYTLELKCEREKFMRGNKGLPGDKAKVRGTVSGDTIIAKRGDVTFVPQSSKPVSRRGLRASAGNP